VIRTTITIVRDETSFEVRGPNSIAAEALTVVVVVEGDHPQKT
jgi:hypothetical protein